VIAQWNHNISELAKEDAQKLESWLVNADVVCGFGHKVKSRLTGINNFCGRSRMGRSCSNE